MSDHQRTIFIRFSTWGAVLGLIYALIEYNFNDLKLMPIIIRGTVIGFLIGASIVQFENTFSGFFKNRIFYQIILLRGFSYAIIIMFWLSLINTISNTMVYNLSFFEAFKFYLESGSILTNYVISFVFILIAVSIFLISKLHRQGELLNYIIGKYQTPKEENRLFLFVDLKNSTKIGEKLGHLEYGKFLQKFFSDITEPLISSKAVIYQYAGDEVILTWKTPAGYKQSRCIHCFFDIRKVLLEKRKEYLDSFGEFPEIRGSLHGGDVIITWIGELKREIVYVGDVLNTTSRLLNVAKHTENDFITTETVIKYLETGNEFTMEFLEEMTLRGKEKSIKAYSVDQASTI